MFWLFSSLIIFLIAIVIYSYLNRSSKIRSLQGKHVLITGGSSGIGKAAAVEAAKRNAHVTIVGRNVDRLKIAVTEIKASAASEEQKIQYISLDVTHDYDVIKSAFEKIEQVVGPIFMLINCAGMAICGRFEDMSPQEIKNLIDLNYFGTAYSTKYVLPGMKARGEGSIILVSTEAALLGIYGYSAYGAAKWAVRGLGEALLMELVDTGVSITICFPPDTDTPGFAIEEQSKPKETKLISDSGGLHTAEFVAKQLIKDALARKFYSVVGVGGWMLVTLFCGSVESVKQVLVQTCLMGLFRLISASYLYSFHCIIRSCREERQKKSRTKKRLRSLK